MHFIKTCLIPFDRRSSIWMNIAIYPYTNMHQSICIVPKVKNVVRFFTWAIMFPDVSKSYVELLNLGRTSSEYVGITNSKTRIEKIESYYLCTWLYTQECELELQRILPLSSSIFLSWRRKTYKKIKHLRFRRNIATKILTRIKIHRKNQKILEE